MEVASLLRQWSARDGGETEEPQVAFCSSGMIREFRKGNHRGLGNKERQRRKREKKNSNRGKENGEKKKRKWKKKQKKSE